VLVLSGANDVPFRVEEVDASSYSRNVEFRCRYSSAIRFYGADGLVDIFHRNRALEADHFRARDQFAALLKKATDRRSSFLAGLNQIEVGWPPGLELPSKDLLIEALSAWYVVCIDGETSQVVWHGESVEQPIAFVLRYIDKECRKVAKPEFSLRSRSHFS